MDNKSLQSLENLLKILIQRYFGGVGIPRPPPRLPSHQSQPSSSEHPQKTSSSDSQNT